MMRKVIEFNREIDKIYLTIMVGNFNIPLSTIDGKSTQIGKDIELNIINKLSI